MFEIIKSDPVAAVSCLAAILNSVLAGIGAFRGGRNRSMTQGEVKAPDSRVEGTATLNTKLLLKSLISLLIGVSPPLLFLWSDLQPAEYRMDYMTFSTAYTFLLSFGFLVYGVSILAKK